MTEAEEKKHPNMALIIAIIGLVGTLAAALLNSPVLIALIERETAAPPTTIVTHPPGVTTSAQPPGKPTDIVGANEIMVFHTDFENGLPGAFTLDRGNWTIEKDKSNQVLQLNAGSELTSGSFGPTDFKNGIIQFDVRFTLIGDTGGLILFYRYTGEESYAVYLQRSQILMGNRIVDADQQIVQFSNSTLRPLNLQTNTWHTVRIEARGSQLSISLDGNQLFKTNDTRLTQGSILFSLDQGWQAMLDNISVWSLAP